MAGAKFSLSAKQFFLTYPRCDLEMDEALAQLRSKFRAPIEAHLIAREDHKEPAKEGEYDTQWHLHVYIKFARKVRIAKPNKLDLISAGRTFHGNYQTCRSANAVKEYCKKDGLFIASDNIDDPTGTADPWAEAMALAKGGDVEGAVLLLETEKPRDMLLQGVSLRSNLQLLAPAPVYGPPSGHLPLRDLPNLSEALQVLGTKSLVVWGPAGTGKTCWARALGPHRFLSHLEGLKTTGGIKSGETLIFDDMCFTHLPRSPALFLFDCEQPRDIHVRYTTVHIPAGVHKIFLTNLSPDEFLGEWVSDGAFLRRILFLEVHERLWEADAEGDGSQRSARARSRSRSRSPPRFPDSRGARASGELVEYDGGGGGGYRL